MSPRSQELRAALFEKNPLLGLASLRGTRTELGDAWLERMAQDAPKPVLSALAGRQDELAYLLRDELFETGREVIDTVRRLSDDRAFALRERALPRWASTVAHSLLGVPDSARARSILERCRALGERDLHVQRRLHLLEEQTLAPAWTHPSRISTQPEPGTY